MVRRSRERELGIEDVLSSRGRVRILKLLAEAGELNISEIVRRSELNHTVTLRHLEALEKAGLITQRRFGRVRIFRYRDDDLRGKLLKSLLVSWDGV